jgi:3-methyladenine DNA glycosylase AlkD
MPAAAAFASAEKVAKEIAEKIRGLKTAQVGPLRAARRESSKHLAEAPGAFVVDVAMRLLSEPAVDRFVAYELIRHHPAAASSLRERHITRLGRGLDSWGAVDSYACYIVGPAWRERQVPDKLIHRWARSKDRWWRRAALVSTVPLNSKAQGGSGDTRRTLEICRMLLADRDDMVVKAMSWALRELSKRDPRAVRRFLIDHIDEIASRVGREVVNKLSTGLKNPKRPAKRLRVIWRNDIG